MNWRQIELTVMQYAIVFITACLVLPVNLAWWKYFLLGASYVPYAWLEKKRHAERSK